MLSTSPLKTLSKFEKWWLLTKTTITIPSCWCLPKMFVLNVLELDTWYSACAGHGFWTTKWCICGQKWRLANYFCIGTSSEASEACLCSLRQRTRSQEVCVFPSLCFNAGISASMTKIQGWDFGRPTPECSAMPHRHLSVWPPSLKCCHWNAEESM